MSAHKGAAIANFSIAGRIHSASHFHRFSCYLRVWRFRALQKSTESWEMEAGRSRRQVFVDVWWIFGCPGETLSPQRRFLKAFSWIFPEDAFLVGAGERFGRGRHVIGPHRRSPNAVFGKHTLARKGSILESLWEAFGRLWATFGRLRGAPGRFFYTGGAGLVLLQ